LAGQLLAAGWARRLVAGSDRRARPGPRLGKIGPGPAGHRLPPANTTQKALRPSGCHRSSQPQVRAADSSFWKSLTARLARPPTPTASCRARRSNFQPGCDAPQPQTAAIATRRDEQAGRPVHSPTVETTLSGGGPCVAQVPLGLVHAPYVMLPRLQVWWLRQSFASASIRRSGNSNLGIGGCALQSNLNLNRASSVTNKLNLTFYLQVNGAPLLGRLNGELEDLDRQRGRLGRDGHEAAVTGVNRLSDVVEEGFVRARLGHNPAKSHRLKVSLHLSGLQARRR